ncbi:hypothetical protein [Pseudomonas oryzihabitans]|uniref:Uncharacterized protein n=1 Tax=Pseudomonas oryzihabitans TaxID=47885 RepID=A0ABX3IUY7_9PSED|nr:hypothetical protein [Pseudomonas psychrotolerans]ONN71686.1 hypothetical protein BVL52_08560 [Pseudomonas psychrotolerans]
MSISDEQFEKAVLDLEDKASWHAKALRERDATQRAEIDKLRAALATQPAAGEPIQVETVAITREDEDGLYLDWVLEGGISALEAPGVVLLVAHGEVTDRHGSGEVYMAPPAAAHGYEAVRKGLCDAYERGYQDGQKWPDSYSLQADKDRVADELLAAMRAQGDGETRHG